LSGYDDLARSVTFNPPYIRLGPSVPEHPLLISVPHAGRDYPREMAAMARLGAAELKVLEDRFADQLIDAAVAAGFSALVATTPRGWIDLNRAEREYDPGLIEGERFGAPIASAKVRGGLGIIPRRIARGGDIWRGAISADDFAVRLSEHYRPFHAALDALIEARIARFGVAILLDIHSMPPIASLASGDVPRVIIGDLFGRSAASRFSHCATHIVAGSAISVSTNIPYAGGHILERHGRPLRGVHALQIEIDRSLYLDARFDQPGDGLAAMQALIRNLAVALSQKAAVEPLLQAAE
jgi:N-formylglutamate amidohydrolase